MEIFSHNREVKSLFRFLSCQPLSVEWKIEKFWKHESECEFIQSPKLMMKHDEVWYLEVGKSGRKLLLNICFENTSFNFKYLIVIRENAQNLFNWFDSVSSSETDKIFLLKEQNHIDVTFSENLIISLSTDITETVQVPTVTALKELSLDFKKAYDECIDADVTIHTEDEFFRVHKFILRTRSPVFNKMFDYDSNEAQTNKINLTDIRSSVLKNFLLFLYSGSKEQCNLEDTIDLYYAADKYEVPALKKVCHSDLQGFLLAGNACSLLSFASRHNDDVLQEVIMRFIRQNLESVIGSDSWEKLMREEVDLAITLIRFCVKSVQPEENYKSEKKVKRTSKTYKTYPYTRATPTRYS